LIHTAGKGCHAVTNDQRGLTAALLTDLIGWRTCAGYPSLKRIEGEAERLDGMLVHGVRITQLPHSTVHDLLRGVRPRPLRPELVESLWAVLRHLADARGGRHDRLTSLSELRNRLAMINTLWHIREVSEMTRTDTGGTAASAAFDPFGCPPTDGDEESIRRWLLERSGGTQAQAWWYGGRHLVPAWLAPYLTLEWRAEAVRAYAPWYIPGILQTEEYAWAAFRRERPLAVAAELAGLVHLRMRRQEPLWRRDALRFWVVIDEVALRTEICDRAAMRAQFDHLIKVAAMPNITVQIMRGNAPGHGAADGPLALLRFPEHMFPDVVFVEQRDYGLYPTGGHDVGHYRQLLGRLAIEALTPDESADVLWALRSSYGT